MKTFNLKVVTPDGLAFDQEVESLLVRADDGYVEFLAGHIDYMASIDTGRARIKADGKDRYVIAQQEDLYIRDVIDEILY